MFHEQIQPAARCTDIYLRHNQRIKLTVTTITHIDDNKQNGFNSFIKLPNDINRNIHR